MPEYIRKEQVIELLHYNTDEACSSIVTDVEQLPAADVAPVVNARWEWITENLYKCPHCHTKTLVDEFLNKTLYIYCPYCGARMDGGESGD